MFFMLLHDFAAELDQKESVFSTSRGIALDKTILKFLDFAVLFLQILYFTGRTT
jgi:hypothetical protein